MIERAHLRIGLLALTLVATLVAGVRMYRSAVSLDPAPPPVEFPAEPHVPDWTRLGDDTSPYPAPKTARYRTQTEATPIELELQFIPDLPVHYVRNPLLQERFLHRGELPLDAGLRFSVNSRAGIIPNLRDQPPEFSTLERHPEGYGIWTADDRIHLTTIVTASGDSAISRPEVARSMFLDHLSVGQVWSWVCGRTVLPDRRCVLIHFSMAKPSGDLEPSRQMLATALAEWRAAHPLVFPPWPIDR